MAFINHPLGKTFFTSKGRKSDGIPLIWLHGGPGGYHRPDSQIFKLAKNRKVICYDQLGGGKSSAISQNKMKIETFVQELKYLVKAWNLDEFHLGGGSWGTTLALEYYLRTNGKGIKSLTFQSPMFSAKLWENDANKLIAKMSKEDQKIIKYCHEINATDSKVYQNATMNYYLRHVLRNRKKLLEFSKIKNPNGNKVYSHMWGPSEFKAMGTLKNYNQVKALKKIKVPTLLICGQHDEATPATVKLFHKNIKGASFSVINSASHSILTERPKDMLKVLDNFYTSIS